jgi:hypothetical protein
MVINYDDIKKAVHEVISEKIKNDEIKLEVHIKGDIIIETNATITDEKNT